MMPFGRRKDAAPTIGLHSLEEPPFPDTSLHAAPAPHFLAEEPSCAAVAQDGHASFPLSGKIPMILQLISQFFLRGNKRK